MLSWLRQIRWPWQKRASSALPARTADALRRLYYRHQRQRRLWGYIVLTALLMSCLFLGFSMVTKGGFWVVAIPLIVVVFSVYQMRRNRDLSRLLRQALTVQSQIDKAQSEAQRQAEEEGEQIGAEGIPQAAPTRKKEGEARTEDQGKSSGNGRTNGSMQKGGNGEKGGETEPDSSVEE